MDRAISASEANQHFSEMLREVGQGESFVVMSRGRPVARVVPAGSKSQRRAVRELLDFLEGVPRRSARDWRRQELYD